MSEAIVVVTTTAQPEEAAILANLLVEQMMAACVQILGPVKSIYRWQEKVESASESLLLIKTTQDAYPRVERAIKEIHRQRGWYETPEILALSVESGSADYLEWLMASVSLDRRKQSELR